MCGILVEMEDLDQVLTGDDTHWVVNVLKSCSEIVANPYKLGGALGLQPSVLNEIKLIVANQPQSHLYNSLQLILTKWMTKKGEGATFAELVSVLNKESLNFAANQIIKQAGVEIRLRAQRDIWARQESPEKSPTESDARPGYQNGGLPRRGSTVFSQVHIDAAKFLSEMKIKETVDTLRLYNESVQNCMLEVERMNATTMNGIILETIMDCLSDLGKYDDVHCICMCYLENQEKVSQSELELLDTKYLIGTALLNLKRKDEALHYLQKVHMAQVRVLGNIHVSTLKTKIMYAFTLSELGRNKDARSNLSEVLSILEKENPDGVIILRAKMYEAMVKARLGDVGRALSQCENVLELQQQQEGGRRFNIEIKYQLALIHVSMRNHENARILLLEVRKYREQLLGLDHPSTMEVELRIAQTLSALADNRSAFDLLSDLCERHERVLGPSHENTLRIKRCCAQVSSRLGCYTEALKRYEEVYKEQEQVNSIEHPTTLETKYQMGITMASMKRFNEALILFSDVRKAQIRTYEKDHHSILLTQSDEAAMKSELGQYEDASKIFQELIPSQIKVLGEDHPETLRSRRFAAQNLARRGNYSAAETNLIEICKAQKEKLGEEHPSILETSFQLGVTLKLQRKVDHSLAELQQVYNSQLRVLGEKHPLSLITRIEIAIVMSDQSHNVEALKHIDEILLKCKAREYQLPAIDIHVANMYRGQILSRLGRNKEAYAELSDLLATQENLSGLSYPTVLELKYQIGVTTANMQDHEQALNKFFEVLREQIRILGEDHPAVLKTKTYVAKEMSEIGRNEEALIKLDEIEVCLERKLGKGNLDTLRCRRYKARTQTMLGKFAEAIKSLEDIARIQEAQIGADHPALLETMYQMALTYKQWGNLDRSLNIWRKVLKTQQLVLPEKHPKILQTQIRVMGVSLDSTVDIEETLTKLEDLIKTSVEILGGKHQDTLRARKYKAQGLSYGGRHKDAIMIFQEIRQLQEEEFGMEHPLTLETKYQIGLCQQKMGRSPEAFDTFRQANKIHQRILPSGHPAREKTNFSNAAVEVQVVPEPEKIKKPEKKKFLGFTINKKEDH